eukprot:1159895-Pelagomonas_calceolata.AAC.10
MHVLAHLEGRAVRKAALHALSAAPLRKASHKNRAACCMHVLAHLEGRAPHHRALNIQLAGALMQAHMGCPARYE